MKIVRHPEYFTDDEGRRLVRVPINGSNAPMVTEADLFDNARHHGRWTGVPFINHNGQGNSYVCVWQRDKGRNGMAARLLIDCPKGYQVRYNDGSPLNVLPENLRLVATWADQALAQEVLELLLTKARRKPAELLERTHAA